MGIMIYLEIAGLIATSIGVRYSILQYKESKKQTQLAEKSSTGGIDKSLYRVKPTPQDIYRAIEDTQPYLQRETRISYRNLKVNWNLYLHSIGLNRIMVYRLYLYPIGFDSPLVVCDVNIIKYSEFKVMKKEQKVRVFGEISSISKDLINLKNCHFEFDVENSPSII